jgi:hypothetical protein
MSNKFKSYLDSAHKRLAPLSFSVHGRDENFAHQDITVAYDNLILNEGTIFSTLDPEYVYLPAITAD